MSFFRYICGAIVQHNSYYPVIWISPVDNVEQLDKLSASVEVFDQHMNFHGMQIDATQ